VKAPQVVLFSLDDWLGNQLRELATDHRWLLRESRQLGAFAKHFDDRRPSIAVVQFDPRAVKPEIVEAIALLAGEHPEVAIIAVGDSKISEEHLPDWTAALLDIGCRWVLYPPLTRAVLEDLLSGWMTALTERMKWPAGEKAIDLAAGSYEEVG
jgi:hypothetical protein